MTVNFGDFRGAAKRLEDRDLPRIGKTIGVGEDEIHAVLDVESAGSGFDSLGRPKMLFEPHVFYRLLGLAGLKTMQARALDLNLAYPKWGEQPYPKDSYPKLEAAMKLHRGLALQSASWGLGQVMGFNYAAAGFNSVEAMVLAFMEDEDNQLEAMIAFITHTGLARFLRAHDWESFADGYNGHGFRKNGYHLKLEAAYERWLRIKDTPE